MDQIIIFSPGEQLTGVLRKREIPPIHQITQFKDSVRVIFQILSNTFEKRPQFLKDRTMV